MTASPNPTPSQPISGLERDNTYDCVPQLGPAKPGDLRPSLLPQQGGVPGLTYAQYPAAKIRLARERGWFPIIGSDGEPSRPYTIRGPKGEIDMLLLASGKRIPGLAPESGRRRCFVHLDVYEATGLDPETGLPPEKPSGPAKQKAA